MATTVKIAFGADEQWQQRAGRKATPVPSHISDAVSKCHKDGTTARVQIADDTERKALIGLLRKAGRQLGVTVLIQEHEGGNVLFKATDKVSRPRKPKDEQPAASAA